MGGPGSGRKPTPTLRLVADGGKPSSRASKSEPKPAPKIPEPPEELALYPRALAEWRRAGVQLYALGIISDVDQAVFAQYCFKYALWKEAIRSIQADEAADRRRHKRNRVNRGGILVRSTKGTLMLNPSVRAEAELGKQVRSLAAELGMTPSGRSKIKADTAPSVEGDEDDDFDG